MSILLEALRKSEKDQQKPEVPGIHSDAQARPVSQMLKKAPLVLLIVVLSAAAWYGWQQYRLSAESYPLPATGTAGKTTAPEKTGASGTPLVKLQTGDNKGAPSATVAGVTAGRQRTPVESYQQPTRGKGKAEPANGTQTAKQAGGAAKKKPASKKPAANKQAATKAAGRKLTSTRPSPANPKKPPPHVPAPISYWELPDAIRANVPDMSFSVLVYAQDPADRFVLIDGQRFGQGDQVQPELFVREIRRVGVVFRYRLYKFLVEK